MALLVTESPRGINTGWTDILPMYESVETQVPDVSRPGVL